MENQFINNFEQKVKKTIEEYGLADKGDKIFVACSGGKDSTTVLYLLNKFGCHVEALTIDLLIGDYSKKNIDNIKEFCEKNNIRLNLISMREEFGCSVCYIRSGVQQKRKLSSCMICGVIKRWLLNKKSRELGATKLATGHNLDDESETLLMNLFKGNLNLGLGLGPKAGIIKDAKFVPRIKPLYFCTNEEVKKYSQIMGFPVIYGPCPCSVGVFRRHVRNWITELQKQKPNIKENIVKSYLKLLPILKEKYKTEEKMKYCEICEEPSRKEICKRCELIMIMGEK